MATPTLLTRKQRKPRKPNDRVRFSRKIDDDKVIELAAKGLNSTEIAQHQGVAPSTIWRFLRDYQAHKLGVKKYKEDRADHFAELQGKAIEAQHILIDSVIRDGISDALDQKSKGAIMNAINNVMGTAYDKERLETGKSTQNVSTLQRILGAGFESAHNPLITNEAKS